MIRVLFVCLGNICRSPMAEAVFAQKVRDAGLESQITADSAGTGAWHVGNPPHFGTRRVLERRGIDYQHRARQISTADLSQFDYIIAMDDQNLSDVQILGSSGARIARLLDYAPHKGLAEVPDPYYTGGFDAVYELVEAATEGLLAAIRRDHAL